MRKRKYKKMIKIVSITLLVLALLTSIIGYFIGNYFYNLALNPTTDKSTVLEAPQNKSSITTNEVAQQWFNSSKYKDIYITARDQLRLHAYQINQPVKSNNWVIICHGYAGKASSMQNAAKHFYDQGYEVLMPDARGHGQSDGKYIGMGWDERLDMIDWIHQITTRNPQVNIVLYGVSMGASTVLMTSGENLPKQVKTIIEDCGYTSVRDIFTYQLKSLFNLPGYPILDFANVVTQIRAGYNIDNASAIKQVKKSKTPTLFIHGDEDTFVPSTMVYQLYNSATVPKELFIVKGANHAKAADIAKEEYWKKVFQFIGKFIDDKVAKRERI